MKSFINVIIGFLLFALVIGGIGASGYGVYYFVTHFKGIHMTDQVLLYLLIGLTAIICSLIIAGGLRPSKTTNNLMMEGKLKTYQRFIELWMQPGDLLEKVVLEEELKSLQKDMAIYGNDRSLKQFLLLHEYTLQRKDEEILLNQAEKTLIEMRRDIGHANIGFRSGQLKELLSRNIRIIV